MIVKVYFLNFVLLFSILLSLNAQEILIPDSIQDDLISLNEKARFQYFIDLSKKNIGKNAQNALNFAQLAYQEAAHNLGLQEKIDAYLVIGNAYNDIANYDTVILIADQIIEETDKESLRYFKAKLILANALHAKGKYSESKKQLDEIVPYAVEHGDSVLVNKAVTILGNVYNSLGDYSNTLMNYQRALAISDHALDTAKMMGLYTKIGRMYLDMESFQDAKINLNRAVLLSDNQDQTVEYKVLMNHLGSYYNRMHIYDSAKMYYQKSLAATLKLGKKDDIAGMYLNLGNLSCRLGDFETGTKNFDTALLLFKQQKLDVYIGKVYDSYSVMYVVRKKYDSSLYYAQKVLKIAKETKNAYLIRTSYYRIAAVYDKMKDYKSSLDYAKQYIFYNDSIMGAENRAKVLEMETKYETAKKERDIIQLKAQQKAQEDKETMLWISIAAILVIFVLIVMGVQQKRKKDKTIYQKEKVLAKKEKDLAKAELEKSQYKELELKKEIQYKSKQLTTHALNMMQKNTLMQEIQEELVMLGKKASTENKGTFSRLKMLIKKNLRSDNDWDLFKLYFEDVNKEFYRELASINTDLTSNDLKLCALLKLNMNIKESASVMNIEPASVKTARYKLRKKLKLKPDDDLIEFIRNIG